MSGAMPERADVLTGSPDVCWTTSVYGARAMTAKAAAPVVEQPGARDERRATVQTTHRQRPRPRHRRPRSRRRSLALAARRPVPRPPLVEQPDARRTAASGGRAARERGTSDGRRRDHPPPTATSPTPETEVSTTLAGARCSTTACGGSRFVAGARCSTTGDDDSLLARGQAALSFLACCWRRAWAARRILGPPVAIL